MKIRTAGSVGNVGQPLVKLLVSAGHKVTVITSNPERRKLPDHSRDIYQEILEQLRQWLIQKNHEKNTLSEEVVRRHLLYLDLEEEKLKFL